MNKTDKLKNNIFNSNRETWLDILKAIAVSSVVFHHAGFPVFFLGMIFVSVFFISSGYVFKEQSFLQYMKKQFLRLWIPFVVANFLAVLLHNLLTVIGLWPGYPYEIKDIALFVVRSFAFCFSDALCSPHWFVFMIFTAGIAFYGLYYLSCLIAKYLCIKERRKKEGKENDTVDNANIGTDKFNRVRDIVLGVISAAMFIYGLIFNHGLNTIMWSNCAFVTNIFYGMILFWFGYAMKRYDLVSKLLSVKMWAKVVIFAVFTAILSIAFIKGYIADHRAGNFTMAPIVPFISLMGFVWLLLFAKAVIEKIPTVRSIVCYMGRNSLYIMLYQGLAYQLVTFIQVKICHIPYDPAWQWQNVYMGSGLWVSLAGVCGVLLPLLIPIIKEYFSKVFKSFCSKKS